MLEEGTTDCLMCFRMPLLHYQIVDLESIVLVFIIVKEPTKLRFDDEPASNYSESPAIRRQYCPARTATMSRVMFA